MTGIDLLVAADGTARFAGRIVRCALGRLGISPDKREGDGTTPAGSWPCRQLYWRAERLPRPATALTAVALTAGDGWCDDPADPAYNRAVHLPYPASAEALWRGDAVYDLIVPLGYNDAPVVPGRGSAIFLHVARPDLGPTEGCVALERADLLAFLALAGPSSQVIVARSAIRMSRDGFSDQVEPT